jgi:hypothetical protein
VCTDCSSPDRICNTWCITEKCIPRGPDQNHPDQPGFGIVEKGQTLGEASGSEVSAAADRQGGLFDRELNYANLA